MPLELNQRLAARTRDELKRRLNIDQIPSDLERTIDKTSATVASHVVAHEIETIANQAAKQEVRREELGAAVQGRLATALEGVRIVTASESLKQILTENASMLFAKRQALEAAGFTSDEAFQLILAEVRAKHSR